MRLVSKNITLILPRVWLKTKITQIHALAKTRNHCFDQYILYHQHSYTNSALLQRRILVLGKHVGSKNDERLVWKQLCARNKVFNRLICEPLARCAKRGSSLPLGTPMEIDFTSAYLHYPLPQCSKIVAPIIFSISYELFRLPSAQIPHDYQLQKDFWLTFGKVEPEQWTISWYVLCLAFPIWSLKTIIVPF